jgi:glycosyltransferase involved in cell wall biosynthesis
MTRPALTLGYSALSDRLGGLALPVENPNHEVLVVVQGEPRSVPATLTKRARVVTLTSRGVAKSRNEVIRESGGRYVVFSDDDIVFNESGLGEVVDYLDSHPDVSLVLAQAVDDKGRLRKKYPTRPTRLGLFNSAKAATYEMVLRLDDSRSSDVWFDEDFGAGAVNYLGDEYIFIVDLVRAGRRCMFLPITIAMHPEESSGSRWGTEADLRARATIFTRVFGALAPFVRIAFGAKHLGRRMSFGQYLRFIRG